MTSSETIMSVEKLQMDKKSTSSLENKQYSKELSETINVGEAKSIFKKLEYDGKAIFWYKAGVFITTLWYKKEKNEWFWTPDNPFKEKENWIPASKLLVETGHWKGQMPAEINQNFIKWLSYYNPSKPR